MNSHFSAFLCLPHLASWGLCVWEKDLLEVDLLELQQCLHVSSALDVGGAVNSDIVCGFDLVMALQFSANAVVAESTRDGTMIPRWCCRRLDA